MSVEVAQVIMKKIISNRTLLLITVQSYNEILIILTISGCKLAKLIIYQLNTSNTSRIKRKKGSQSTSFVHLLFFAILTWYNNQNIYIYYNYHTQNLLILLIQHTQINVIVKGRECQLLFSKIHDLWPFTFRCTSAINHKVLSVSPSIIRQSQQVLYPNYSRSELQLVL